MLNILKRKGLLLLIFITITVNFFSVAICQEQHTDGCPVYTAPLRVRNTLPLGQNEFLNPKLEWGNTHTDSGVIIDGYVALTSAHSLKGVDLSANNDFLLKNFSRCPPDFAIIKLDKKFSSHAKSLRLLGQTSIIIPYFWMDVPNELRKTDYYAPFGLAEVVPATQMAAAWLSGERQGQSFYTAWSQLPEFHGGGVKVGSETKHFIVLDAEYKLIDETRCPVFDVNKQACRARELFGQIYAHQICAWSRKIASYDDSFVPVLYTSPSVYSDYLRFATASDDTCISGLPVYVARTRFDADDATPPEAGDTVLNTRRKRDLCHSPVGNRCIIHQYTHRAELGSDKIVYAEMTHHQGPWHIDLDRFFASKSVRSNDNKIVYYVRSDGEQP